jgi:hypothetical protein
MAQKTNQQTGGSEASRVQYRKGTFEARMNELLPDNSDSFSVRFFDLWRDSESGWSVNDSWQACSDESRAGTIRLLRSRWEIFKLNYSPKACVSDIQDIGDQEGEYKLEVDYTAFADVTAY